MRPLLLLLLGATCAFSQPFSFGARVGVPLTDFVNAASSGSAGSFLGYTQHTDRFVVGATGELRLPFHLGIELDVLYRHYNFQDTQQTSGVTPTSTNAFEFPVLGKYRFGTKLIHPYVDAGVAWDTLQELTQAVTSPSQLENNTTRGYVFGGGLDFKFLLIHIQPEIRYTRWGARHFFDPSGLLSSNRNQAEFLLGIEF